MLSKRLSLANLLLILLTSIPLVYTKGQVTIGSGEQPGIGTLLDLKEKTSTLDGITATKGLNLPRVKLTNLKPSTPADLASSIGGTGNWDKDEHIGLTVYNMNENQCAATPILKGLYIWDGTEWLLHGKSLPGSINAVSYYQDTRPHGDALAGTTQIYPYRTFGTAGTWMLENMRYIPDDGGASMTEDLILTFDPDIKLYAYPNITTSTSSWSPEQGLLYTYSAMTLGIQDGVTATQGVTNTTNTPGTNEIENDPLWPEKFQGICPPGWHIPSDREWNELEEYIYNHVTDHTSYTSDDINNPAIWSPTTWDPAWNNTGNRSKIQKALLSSCNPPNSTYNDAGINKSLPISLGGFNAIPVGIGHSIATYNYGHSTAFWTVSVNSNGNAWLRHYYTDTPSDRGYDGKYNLYSVRCKK